MARTVSILLAAGLALAGPGSAGSSLVINELAPDPDGADAGREFVEILNVSGLTISLDGVSLEFANGAEGAVWRTRWEAAPGLVLAPGERFLLADRNWQGPEAADAEAYLGLQNGPDAVRLVRHGIPLDLVGWGPLTDPELMETSPVAVETGSSLARRPDGRDTGDNGADFVVAAPTPGAPNFERWALTVVAVVTEPPSLRRPGDPLELDVEVRNDGLEDWPVSRWHLRTGSAEGTALVDACPAGGTHRFSWRARPLDRGPVAVSGTVALPDGTDSLVLDLGRVQVGAGALALTEVMAAPRRDEGEWIELEAVASCDLAGWRLCDEGGEWRTLPAGRLEAGERVVLAQDAAALENWLLEVRSRGGLADCPAPAAVLELAGWPNLNNSAPADRIFAERLRLADSTGTVVDHVVVGGPDGRAPDGLSWERAGIEPVHPAGDGWAVCTARTGATPGCPNSLTGPVPAGGALTTEPAVLTVGAGAVHLRFRLGETEGGWRLRVYDLWGAPVRDFGGDDLGPGPRDLVWDGTDDRREPLPAGGYVALLVVLDGTDRCCRRERAVVVLR